MVISRGQTIRKENKESRKDYYQRLPFCVYVWNTVGKMKAKVVACNKASKYKTSYKMDLFSLQSRMLKGEENCNANANK